MPRGTARAACSDNAFRGSKMKAELDERIARARALLEENPQRRMDICEGYISRNEKRPFACLFLNIAPEPAKRKPFRADETGKSAEERLADNLLRMTQPLRLQNPVAPYIVLGVGPGSMIASFGLDLDPDIDYTPRGHKTADEVIAAGVPDPEKSGMMPRFLEDIDAAVAYTPAFFKIEKPDMQGPFNIAHAVLGDEAFTLPYTAPEKFNDVMRIVTEFYIRADELFSKRIGKERTIPFPRHRSILAECSCNLVSEEFYLKFVLPFDLAVCRHYGEVCVHPCSGPHVFYETLRNLPNVVYTEAGEMLSPMTAGCIGVEDALREIGDRPIVLNIGQELPHSGEFGFICKDFDRAKGNNRLLFGYTSGKFKEKDIPLVLDLHKRLDDYWAEHVYPGK